MTIPFLRVGQAPLAIDDHDTEAGCDLVLKGEMTHYKEGLIHLKARLSGRLPLLCDRCGGEWLGSMDEPVELLLSDGLYQEDDAQPLPWPVVEMTGGRIDSAVLIRSEKEAYRCGYHHCLECAQKDSIELNEGD